MSNFRLGDRVRYQSMFGDVDIEGEVVLIHIGLITPQILTIRYTNDTDDKYIAVAGVKCQKIK